MRKKYVYLILFLISFCGLKELLLNHRPGYKELREVEVVKHDKICSGVIKDVPTESGRFLGDISGMAEYLNGSVIFCRHKSCWRLDVARNSWSKVISGNSWSKVISGNYSQRIVERGTKA